MSPLYAATGDDPDTYYYQSRYRQVIHSDDHRAITHDVTQIFSCFSRYSGVALPCSIQSEIIGISEQDDIAQKLNDAIDPACGASNIAQLINHGGHTDNEAAEELILSNENGNGYGSMTFNLDAQEDQYFVSGTTMDDDLELATIQFDAPEFAKVIHVESVLTPPYRWHFTHNDEEYRHNHYDFRFIIGLPNKLNRLPGCISFSAPEGEKYRIGRSDGADHPEGNWGTPLAIQRVKEIASEAHRCSGGVVHSFNDMSLPLGGKFDVPRTNSNSFGAHKTHRDGKDIDVNKGINFLSCDEFDVNFRNNNCFEEAVEDVADEGQFPEFQCENYNNYNLHIDLER